MAPQQWPWRGPSTPPLALCTPACRRFWSSGSLCCTWASAPATSTSRLGTDRFNRPSTPRTIREFLLSPCQGASLRVQISGTQLVQSQDQRFCVGCRMCVGCRFPYILPLKTKMSVFKTCVLSKKIAKMIRWYFLGQN